MGVLCRSLQGNLIECGCSALWLYGYLVENDLNGPVCEQPQELRGLLLLDLTTLQFCGKCTCIYIQYMC